MAYSRYTKRGIIVNDNKGYQEEFFEDRGIKKIDQYSTGIITYPSNEQMADMEIDTRVWGATDKLYNVANAAYGSPELWWVIAWFNKKPTAAHFKVGDIVYIPYPLSRALALFGA